MTENDCYMEAFYLGLEIYFKDLSAFAQAYSRKEIELGPSGNIISVEGNFLEKMVELGKSVKEKSKTSVA